MTRESERKRLVELLKSGINKHESTIENYVFPIWEFLADHLIANGIVVPPCKVGDVVWLIGNMKLYTKEEICSRKVISVQRLRTGETLMHFKDGCFPSDAMGVYVFTSREEAVKMLKGDKDSGKS